MKFIGPEGWCSFLEEKLGRIRDDHTVICLNPDRQFRQRVSQLQSEVQSGRKVTVYSLTSYEILSANPEIGPALTRCTFLHGPKQMVLEHFRRGP